MTELSNKYDIGSRHVEFRVWCALSEKMLYGVDIEERRLRDLDGDNDQIYMQYSGELDKNKKDIIEGDIVMAFNSSKEESRLGVMTFYKGTFSLGEYWDDGTHEWYSIEQYASYELEVMGNVFESPELLK